MRYSNKDLRKLILPLMIEQLLAVLIGMTATIMVAGVGEAAVSGVSLVDTINILVINVTAALATGGAIVVGHFLGQGNEEDARKAAWQLIFFSILLSLFVTVVFITLHRPLLNLIFGRVEEEVMTNAVTYLLITAISICPLAVYNSCAALFRVMSDSKTTMWISLLMNVINVSANAILIYKAGMGTAGAAIGTTLSRTVAAVIIFILLYKSQKVIHLRGQLTWRPNGTLVKKILYIGIPNGLENSLFQLGKILLLSLVSTVGTYAIAANAVCNTLAGLNILPAVAINMGLISIASVCIGAADYQQARYYTRKLLIWANICVLIMSVVLFIFSPWIMKIYHLGPMAAELAIKVIRWHAAIAVISWVPSFVLPNTLRSAGDVIWTMTIAIISMWIFRIGFAYLFIYSFNMGLMGVWIAMTIDWSFRAVCYGIRYRGHKWEKFFEKKDYNTSHN